MTQINLPKLKRGSSKVLRSILDEFGGYHASSCEIQAMIDKHLDGELGEDKGRVILPHSHSLVVLPELIPPRLLTEKLSQPFGPTIAGVKPVHILKIGPDQKDIKHVTRYNFKSPLYQKCRKKVGTKEQNEAGERHLKCRNPTQKRTVDLCDALEKSCHILI